MNLILIRDHELLDESTACIRGLRATHITTVLNCSVGDRLRVGRPNSGTGFGEVTSIGADEVHVSLELTAPPESAPDVDLILALPRPRVLRRMLEHVAAMGVRRILIVNSWKVDKSYFGSRLIQEGGWTEPILVGLEQARATCVPEVRVFKLFKPFVEDQLEDLLGDSDRIVLHPGTDRHLDDLEYAARPVVLAIGPEGGWTSYEVEMLMERGFQSADLGPRVLRVETACSAALGQLKLLRGTWD